MSLTFQGGGYKFDRAVKEFVEAVLEKSNSIGVRGEITAQYLKHLGIHESKIDVIGCPSMFMFGDTIPRKTPHFLQKDSTITISYHGKFDNYFKFLDRCKKEYKNYYIIPQGIHDLRLLYAGDNIKTEIKNVHPLYVKNLEYVEFKENRLRAFINVPSWINFLQKADISIGSCIHGSIAAILAGNPTIVFAADARVRELAEYHNMAVIKMEDIALTTKLEKIYEKMDFSKIEKGHKERYKTFIDFLEKNGIETCINSGGIYTDFYYNINLSDEITNGEVMCFNHLEKQKQKEHLTKYLRWIEKKINWHIKEMNNLNIEKTKKGLEIWCDSLKCVMDNLSKVD